MDTIHPTPKEKSERKRETRRRERGRERKREGGQRDSRQAKSNHMYMYTFRAVTGGMGGNTEDKSIGVQKHEDRNHFGQDYIGRGGEKKDALSLVTTQEMRVLTSVDGGIYEL